MRKIIYTVLFGMLVLGVSQAPAYGGLVQNADGKTNYPHLKAAVKKDNTNTGKPKSLRDLIARNKARSQAAKQQSSSNTSVSSTATAVKSTQTKKATALPAVNKPVQVQKTQVKGTQPLAKVTKPQVQAASSSSSSSTADNSIKKKDKNKKEKVISINRLFPIPLTKKRYKFDQAKIGTTEITQRYLVADPRRMSAGSLIYTERNGERQVLLTKADDDDVWGAISGDASSLDDFVYDTATRVLTDLTKGYLNFGSTELLNAPSHDYVSNSGLERLYLLPHSPVDADEITTYVEVEAQKLVSSGNAFLWIPIKDVVKAVMSGPFVKAEGNWTATVDLLKQNNQVETLTLDPDLFKSLRSGVALDLLEKISKGEKVPARATVSYNGTDQIQPTVMQSIQIPDLGKKKWLLVDTSKAIQTTDNSKVIQEQVAQTIVKKSGVLSQIKSEGLKTKKALKPFTDIDNKKLLASIEKIRQDMASEPIDSNLSAADQQLKQDFEDIPLSQTEAYLKYRMNQNFLHASAEQDPNTRRKMIEANVDYFLFNCSRANRTVQNACTDNNVDASEHITANLARGSDYFNRNDAYMKTMSDAFEAEIENKGMIPFYHSTNSDSALLFDLYKEFRKQLTAMGSGQEVLRGVDENFFRFNDANDFYRFFDVRDKSRFNYRVVDNINYNDLGLAVNYGIFMSDGHANSETFTFFHDGFNVTSVNTAKLFNTFAKRLVLRSNFDKYKSLFNKFLNQRKYNITKNPLMDDDKYRNSSLGANGRLYQILVHPSVADKVAYNSRKVGFMMLHTQVPGHEVNMPIEQAIKKELGYGGVRDLMKYMRKDPFGFAASMPASTYVIEKKKERGKYTISDIQSRLFMKPELLLNPELVEFKSYWRHPLQDQYHKAYQAKLSALVAEDVKWWLQDQQTAQDNTFIQGPGNTQTPLKKVYEQVKEGLGLDEDDADDNDDNDGN